MLAYVRDQQVDYLIVHKVDRFARTRRRRRDPPRAAGGRGHAGQLQREHRRDTVRDAHSRDHEQHRRVLHPQPRQRGHQRAGPKGQPRWHRQQSPARLQEHPHDRRPRPNQPNRRHRRRARTPNHLGLLPLRRRRLLTLPPARRAHRSRAHNPRDTQWPSKPLTTTGLHKLLNNPYYKGEIHCRGVIYPGAHEPLVDPQTWQQVQDLLAANHHAVVYQRRNLHYLRGSVYCGDCGSRLMITYAKNRWGTTYTYLICSGRARRTTPCHRPCRSTSSKS